MEPPPLRPRLHGSPVASPSPPFNPRLFDARLRPKTPRTGKPPATSHVQNSQSRSVVQLSVPTRRVRYGSNRRNVYST